MRRRTFLQALTAAGPRPNVVLILADDLGSADLSCYGATDIRTPRIDSLARDGVQLTQCYANPECTPTRASLLTGCYAQRFGGLECAIGLNGVGRYDEAAWLAGRGELGLPPQAGGLARLFRDHGYRTAIFGKWHLGYDAKFSPQAHGFDEHFGILGGGADYYTHREPEENGRAALVRNGQPVKQAGYLTDLFAEAARGFLDQHKPGGPPFFLYLPFNAPHTPIQDPDVPGDPGKPGDRRRYTRMVERLDQRVGGILDALATHPNTIVLFFSDNGADANGRNTPLRGRKSSVWEGGIRVAGLVRWPGRVPAGRPSAQVTHVMDVLPTLAEACGLRAPRVDGLSLWPQWSGVKAVRERTLFWRYKRAENRRKAVRAGDWKLAVDGQHESLHNLAADPSEASDLSAAQPRVLARLRAELTAWERRMRPERLREFARR